MNTKASIIKKALYVIIPLALVAAVVIKLKTNKGITESKVYQYDKQEAINVRALTIKTENINAEQSFSGTFEPFKETKVSAELQGKINTIMVDVGSVVKKGQTLIQLDNSLLKLQLQTVEVQIEGLEADVNRYTILAKADAVQGVQLEKAELGLKAAKVQKATLLEQINKSTIKSPFDGVVTAKLSEEGAFAAPGVPLLQITDISHLKFTINVSENEINKFKLHQNYNITLDAFSDLSFTGKLTTIGSKANMGSSFPIQFIVKNTSDYKIKSGMFGKVLLTNQENEQGILIPSSAIMGYESNPQVYLIKDNKATLHNITVSRKIKTKSVVTGGLKDGDVIVINGFINLFDGANVSVK